jgi:hypothetical protein
MADPSVDRMCESLEKSPEEASAANLPECPIEFRLKKASFRTSDSYTQTSELGRSFSIGRLRQLTEKIIHLSGCQDVAHDRPGYSIRYSGSHRHYGRISLRLLFWLEVFMLGF